MGYVGTVGPTFRLISKQAGSKPSQLVRSSSKSQESRVKSLTGPGLGSGVRTEAGQLQAVGIRETAISSCMRARYGEKGTPVRTNCKESTCRTVQDSTVHGRTRDKKSSMSVGCKAASLLPAARFEPVSRLHGISPFLRPRETSEPRQERWDGGSLVQGPVVLHRKSTRSGTPSISSLIGPLGETTNEYCPSCWTVPTSVGLVLRAEA
ncbi:hypothetical protein BJ875DRAFT_98625 [Amylocarpus encephaloides]|uniref:Uncharacterized protein n=1 Tax=Amylocarpus encephaloides TaxID=45428 RepID=A0A9P7YE71_9HELO|nr:hypothetical protein BJ875DRAFT_98625 [Amylocarpus encephaloides]